MGEVWRASDSRLDRDVAIKILPATLAQNPQLRARFEREAKAISALKHPNICTIHDIGSERGIDYLVLELLDGESLASRLDRGPLPIEQVLHFGHQIALALDAAHRRDIIHRDLKPANVMLTSSGARLVDFGLAKSSASSFVVPDGATEARPLTQEGTILGTFQYMAPEQLEGLEADARTDIFALGCVLYEMATGARAFEAASKTSLIARIVSGQPRPLRELQPMTPPAFEHVVDRCLEKEPDCRWQSARDVAEELKWISESGSQAGATTPVARGRRVHERWAWGLAAVLFLAVAALSWWSFGQETPQPQLVRSYLPFPPGTTLDFRNNTASLAISPDGRQLVFSMVSGRKHSLWVRSLDSFESRRLPGTEGAVNPFWSPDGRFVAFFSNDALKKIDLAGSPPVTICKSGEGRDGSWNADDIIVFSPDRLSPIHRVAASGGESRPVTELDQARGETTHRWASFLPDGKHFLFLAGSHGKEAMSEVNAVYVGSLDSPERKLLVQARSNVSYASGHILYVRDNVLLAHPFDPERLEMTGDPVPVAERVAYDTEYFRAVFSVSQNGVLVYHYGGAGQNQSLVLYDRDGNELRKLGQAPKLATYGLIAFSPDGSRAAMEVNSTDSQFTAIWIFDLERGTRTRFTFEEGANYLPVWSPDGRRIAWSHADYATGGWHVYVKDVEGSAPSEHRYGKGREVAWATAFSPDGRSIAVSQTSQNEGGIVMIPDGGTESPATLIDHPEYPERNPSFSPDGKWVSWSSWETGQAELYVASYPELRNRRQVSNGGVGYPAISLWGAGEIIYVTPEGSLTSVDVRDAGTHLDVGAPKPLFELNGMTAIGLSPDGQRIAAVVPAEATHGQFSDDGLMLVVNWPSALQTFR